MKQREPSADLTVSYDSKRYGWGALDRDVERAVGRRSDGAGTSLVGPDRGYRDMFFYFRRDRDAAAAARRVKRALGRRVRVKARSAEQVERDWQRLLRRERLFFKTEK